MKSNFVCLLCNNKQGEFFYQDRKRIFYRCAHCDLIFVSPRDVISSALEKKQYDYHNNDPNDVEYRAFLSRVIVPLKKYITPGMHGLDFGSGPGPTLHLMLEKEGFFMKIWDPFYANDPKQLRKKYDFITSTEVVEHFCNPKQSWRLLAGLIKKGGYLAIMTLLHDKFSQNFASWWYKNDITHVAFYSLKTLLWIENNFNLRLSYCDDRTAIFTKR